jgi:hypothetical protein
LRGAPRLVAFLRYVVDRTLAGRCAEIKSYTIAVEAFGRAPSFEPQADPIVRVEAGRLRRALDHYYASEGHNDPVIIELPRGCYVPRFRRHVPEAQRDERAILQALFHRFSDLHRQLKSLSDDMERAWKTAEPAGRPPPRRN